MEVRYVLRKTPLLEACQVAPEIFEPVIPRLYTFLKPFVTIFHGQAAAQHAKTSVGGLLSDIARKNVASLASRLGQSRLPLQGFIGGGAWDDAPLRHALRDHVKTHVGQADGVLVCDPSGCPHAGRESVGVARQWCGRLGQVDTCQGAIAVGSGSRQGHPLVDTRRYLPQEWTPETARVDQARWPTARRGYCTRHQVALAMLAPHRAGLPHGWMAGDDEMGRPDWFRRRLAALGERYGLAGPAHPARCDLDTALPAASGRGRRPPRPWHHVAAWRQALAAEAWRHRDGCEGSQGPLVVEVVKRRVVSRTHRRLPGDAEMVVVLRFWDRDNQQVVQGDDWLSNAAPETPLGEGARAAKAAHRIAACRQRRKSEAGVADDEGRHGPGWQQHQPLSFLATWFLVRETQRGKKWSPAITFPQIRQGLAVIVREALQCGTMAPMLQERQKRVHRNALARFYDWKQLHRFVQLNLHKRQF